MKNGIVDSIGKYEGKWVVYKCQENWQFKHQDKFAFRQKFMSESKLTLLVEFKTVVFNSIWAVNQMRKMLLKIKTRCLKFYYYDCSWYSFLCGVTSYFLMLTNFQRLLFKFCIVRFENQTLYSSAVWLFSLKRRNSEHRIFVSVIVTYYLSTYWNAFFFLIEN